MKNLFLIFLFLSQISFACPDVAGNYNCSNADGSWDINVSQTEESEITTYYLNSGNTTQIYIADRVKRPTTMDFSDGTYKGVFSTECRYDNSVVGYFLSCHKGSDLEYWRVVSKNDSGNLEINDFYAYEGKTYYTQKSKCIPN